MMADANGVNVVPELQNQSQASQQMTQDVGRIAEMTEHNSMTVSQMSQGAVKLNHLADSLQQTIQHFSM